MDLPPHEEHNSEIFEKDAKPVGLKTSPLMKTSLEQIDEAYFSDKSYINFDSLSIHKVLRHMKEMVGPGGDYHEYPEVHLYYVKFLLKSKRADEVVEHLAPLVQPGGLLSLHPGAYLYYAAALTDDGKPDLAVSILSSNMLPGNILFENSRALPLLARASIKYAHDLVKKGNADLAVQFLRPQVSEGRRLAQFPGVHVIFAEAEAKSGNPDEALRYLNDRVKPGGILHRYARAHIMHSVILNSINRPEDAMLNLNEWMQPGEILDGNDLAMQCLQNALTKIEQKRRSAEEGLAPLSSYRPGSKNKSAQQGKKGQGKKGSRDQGPKRHDKHRLPGRKGTWVPRY
jgi:hypothetical protein